MTFCKERNKDAFKGSPVRAVLNWGRGDGRHLDEESVRLWLIAKSVDQGLKWKSISLYFTALRRYEADHNTAGTPLQSHRITSLLEGIRRDKGDAAPDAVKDPRRPFTADLLWSIEQKCLGLREGRSYEEKLFMAAASVGVGGLLRANEFVSVGPTQRKDAILLIANIKFFGALEEGSGISMSSALARPRTVDHCVLRLRCSKTDQRKRGQDKYLAGKTVEALLDYLACHPRAMDSGSVLFVHRDGTSLTNKELVTMMRAHLRRLGLPEEEVCEYTGHSF